MAGSAGCHRVTTDTVTAAFAASAWPLKMPAVISGSERDVSEWPKIRCDAY